MRRTWRACLAIMTVCLMMAAGAAAETAFAWLGDTCGSLSEGYDGLSAQIDWIIAHAEEENIRFAVHAGDIVCDWADARQWRDAANVMGKQDAYDLILLDLMLPDMDGFTVCRLLREKTDVPILMVTARQDDIDKIQGLGLGADDYIEKPFSPSVLVARVRAHLARYERLTQRKRRKKEICIGAIRLNTETREVLAHGRPVELKNKDYELLRFFMLNPDIVFSKEHIYGAVWGMDAFGDNATVAVHVNRLREKLEKDPAQPQYIQTVWGAGYCFRSI